MEAISERKERGKVVMSILHIIYFLSRDGNTEQPHLITVHHPKNNVVHLRDFKRWLSEFRGREMPESFAWSYKRKYKTGCIWQDLTEDDHLIIPTSAGEFVLSGSLLRSPIKITEQKKNKKEAESLTITSALKKKKHVTFKIENDISPKPSTKINEEPSVEALASTSSSSSEAVERKPTIFMNCWKEEMKRAEHHSCEQVNSKRNGGQFNGVKSKEHNNNGARKWGSVLRKILTCGTVETTENEEKQGDKRNQKREGGRRNSRKSFFFCCH